VTLIPAVRLNNGVDIPQFGFGVFRIKPEDTTEMVSLALKAGYRHIDTAQSYRNEQQVGQAIRQSGIDPAEVFVTTKLAISNNGYDQALAAFDTSIAALGLPKLDLFLIHWPQPQTNDYVATWRALERLYLDGRVRAIGVSNFNPHHIDKLLTETGAPPAVNQIEAHPYLTQEAVLGYDAAHGIATQAWAPLAQGAVLNDPVITDIAAAHQKTPAQTVLRWHIQLGSIVFPRTITPSRVSENLDIFDFHLSGPEMARISALDRNERIGPDPDTF
jgi:2,5-diketo-D-gluconate reductase A